MPCQVSGQILLCAVRSVVSNLKRLLILQCFEAVGWVREMASHPLKSSLQRLILSIGGNRLSQVHLEDLVSSVELVDEMISAGWTPHILSLSAEVLLLCNVTVRLIPDGDIVQLFDRWRFYGTGNSTKLHNGHIWSCQGVYDASRRRVFSDGNGAGTHGQMISCNIVISRTDLLLLLTLLSFFFDGSNCSVKPF